MNRTLEEDLLDRLVRQGREEMSNDLFVARARMNVLRLENAQLRAALAMWADVDKEPPHSRHALMLRDLARQATREILVG